MTPTLLQTVLRRATRLVDDPTAPGASDADLLRRFADGHDEPAFQTLLERHGPLAWAVCRQMLPNPADAEDAFQATFLALVQSAKKLGRVKSVGGWLHGVAVKVCLKVRRSAARRRTRDERSAKPEGVTDPAPHWDDLHAAVHEEVERLPAVLRTVFVLCELEGVRQPDAAAKLGCKLGTVSGRLTRARQSLLKALTARGLTPVLAVGTVAFGSGAAAVPPVLVANAVLYARGGLDAGLSVPSEVWKLAQSVTEGTLMKTKLLAAAVLVAAGLMTAATGQWVPIADAQDVPARDAPRPAPQPNPRPVTQPPIRIDDEEPPVAPQPPRPPVAPRPPRAAEPVPPGPGEPGPPPARDMTRRPQQRMEHLLRDVPGSKDELTKLILDEQAAGWEFAGQVDAGKLSQLVFKRPKGNPVNWAPQPGAGIPRVPAVDPADPLVAPPRRGGPGLPMAVPQPRRGGDRLPPADAGDELPLPAPDLPSRLPPSPIESNPNQYTIPRDLLPHTVPAGEPVRLNPPVIEANPVEIHVLELKNATPTAMALHVKKFFDSAEVSIDEDSGSLVIRCGKKTLEEISKLVEKLDKPSKRPGA